MFAQFGQKKSVGDHQKDKKQIIARQKFIGLIVVVVVIIVVLVFFLLQYCYNDIIMEPGGTSPTPP
jgi:hypothetical protein